MMNAPVVAPKEAGEQRAATARGRRFADLRMGLAARRAAQLPKLTTLVTRDAPDGVGETNGGPSGEQPVDFEYGDCDTLASELDELYSYAERRELADNGRCCRLLADRLGLPGWFAMTEEQRCALVDDLLDRLEWQAPQMRSQALQALAAIVQGCFAEAPTPVDWLHNVRRGVHLCLRRGAWAALMQLLVMEMSRSGGQPSSDTGQPMRLILACMYTMLECVRTSDDGQDAALLKAFHGPLLAELSDLSPDGLVACLLELIVRFCSAEPAIYIPIRKVLLLLWKSLLMLLGGWKTAQRMKNEKRRIHGLPDCEDTIDVASSMAPVSNINCRLVSERDNLAAAGDQAAANGAGDAAPFPRRSRPPPRRQLANLGNSDSDELLDAILDDYNSPTSSGRAVVDQLDDTLVSRPTPRADGTPNGGTIGRRPQWPPGLGKRVRWASKIRPIDLHCFVESKRLKLFGFRFNADDKVSTAGFPLPLRDSIETLSRHVYVSLSDVQMDTELLVHKYPLTQDDGIDADCPAERLYLLLYPMMQKVVMSLVKILLAAVPNSKGKADSVNLVSELQLPAAEGSAGPDAAAADVDRQKEICAEAVGAVLLLLMKHLKLNHVCQFEQLCQHLVFTNCIPLILKYFDQDLLAYVHANSEMSDCTFSYLAQNSDARGSTESMDDDDDGSEAEEEPQDEVPDEEQMQQQQQDEGEAASNALVSGAGGGYLWRNLFTLINLLRMLNKMTKWKHGRTMMLVVYKSAPVLKRALKIKNILLQFYALKLLKSHTKYLGRQWKKSNMDLISAIYSKVRHRMNDDWVYANDVQARSWDFQSEESMLMSQLERFNARRYGRLLNIPVGTDDHQQQQQQMAASGDRIEPIDCDVVSATGKPYVLSERFKKHYRSWLQNEVYDVHVLWESLVSAGGCGVDLGQPPSSRPAGDQDKGFERKSC